jgi:DMSO/TMAO reductase YedYZ molybdopterin-dependent catalytic subunit
MSDVSGPEPEGQQGLPPGQRLAPSLPVLHYGPVPKFRPQSWRLTVNGATKDGDEHHFDDQALAGLPQVQLRGDMHCVTRWSVLDLQWGGVLASTPLALVPPDDDVSHIMAWAEYGFSANLRLADFAAATTLLATQRDGRPLAPEHGYPLRLVVPHLYAWKGPKWLRGIEYLREPRRGFWEERGYHTVGNPWREERWSYQE